jgi:hypothetical protein
MELCRVIRAHEDEISDDDGEPEPEIECEYCHTTTTEHMIETYHGDACRKYPIKCKFCDQSTTLSDLSKHLSVCDKLNQLLLDKHQITSDTRKDGAFIGALTCHFINYKNHPFLEVFDYLKDVEFDIKIKFFYCLSHTNFSNIPDVFDKDRDTVIYKHYPTQIIGEIRHLLSDEFKVNHFIHYLKTNNIKYKINVDMFPYLLEDRKPYQTSYDTSYFWSVVTVCTENNTWQFVEYQEEARLYFKRLLVMLQDKLVLDVAKIILEYNLCDKESGFNKLI